MSTQQHEVPVVVVGGGQAGLATSYHLSRQGVEHVVLDAAARAGDSWRRRWDSLRLFTPARVDHLDGLDLGRRGPVPTKDEFADYLERYEHEFDLPVRHGVRVRRLASDGAGFRLEASDGEHRAEAVVVAMGGLQVPRVPAVAGDLRPGIRTLHSADYRNPSQLADGSVLVVGVGNSGAEIAVEAARDHETWLAGTETGHLPFRVDGWFGRNLGTRVVGLVFRHVLTIDTPVGRRAQPVLQSRADLLVRERPRDLRRAGVHRVPRIEAARDGLPVAADGTVLDVGTVVWCTGYRTGLEEWIDLPVLDERGRVRQVRGVTEVPGLYSVGQDFQYAKASEQIPGVSRDARYVAEHLARQRRGAPVAAG
ncbi:MULTISPECIES: NAD(P)/FAD-dependent oxidoreductase [unclassified Isoptericola]|uniref:flavin-containing monooxygenase n=1 Tax=unclassified Isoptericola TaxID=2623355 RepID=UPI00271414B8|nr:MULTISPECIES: NAD(P)/FAD-dependent oxidoreductase [unclassified Isoptericola]MDO8143719.1 NAD(P)/FAD-dependent oxidoreductase [Isoptericola sp. 178]MDO8147616.1 NAD(P)/FAD-dependent oxidoreductase [Isoptericola sp. b515]